VFQANQDKEWAERTANDEAWKAGACEISLRMLQDYLTLPLDRIAWNHYSYWLLRAGGRLERCGLFIDSRARRDWRALAGQDAPIHYVKT
jgi:hypothetical protein